MTLSVCVMTADPPGRVARVLEPVRGAADEVVLAVDARVPEADIAAYGRLADRLFRIEFRLFERHLAWLHAQCSGDWILRLDGDELVSEAFAARLPELVRSTRVRQYWVPRLWVYPDGEHVLDTAPWSEDHLNRLMRNDGSLRFPGGQHDHGDPAAPAEWLEEPVYHLELLLEDEAQRRDKAVRYEVAAPLRIAPGGRRLNEAFYLPELRPPHELALATVPGEDRPRVRRALDGRTPRRFHPRRQVRHVDVTLAELDRFWEGRSVPGTAYSTAIEPVRPADTMVPDEGRRLLFRVHNQGTEAWPWQLGHRPEIRMSYRWLCEDGSVHTSDGVRTPFPRTVHPGEAVLVPVMVAAPSEPGRYWLEVDVVHDGVTWFGKACRQPVVVQPASALSPAGSRLRAEPGPARRSGDAPIPRAIHRIWLGGAPMPDGQVEFGRSFERLHPDWANRLWTDADLPSLGIGDVERTRARSPAELSNLVRYEILRRHGGVYVDTDVRCLQPFDELIDGLQAFAGLEQPGRVGTAVLGSVPHHPVFERAAVLARQTLGLGLHSADANGPYFLSLLIEQEGGVTLFGADRFYPYLWDEPDRAQEDFSGAHAVHHWTLSWWRKQPA